MKSQAEANEAKLHNAKENRGQMSDPGHTYIAGPKNQI